MAVSVNNKSLLPEIERLQSERDDMQHAAGARRHRRARTRRRILVLVCVTDRETGIVTWRVSPQSPAKRREQHADWLGFLSQRQEDVVPESRSWDEPDDTDEDHEPGGRYHVGTKHEPEDDADMPF
jgi:hypothetical protein